MPDGPIHAWIERSATVIEVIAVAIIFAVVTIGTVRYVLQIVLREADHASYTSYRFVVGRALLLGLEMLVAADVIRTVALAPTLLNIGILGLLVMIRTFLSWSLVLEMEERWPWQPKPVNEVQHVKED
jgi:uncharacterized membrane protein